MNWVDIERAALAAAFRSYGPDAATLCTGWTTRHLLGHLVQREHDPFANIADQLSHPSPGEEKRLGRLVAGTRIGNGFDTLIHRFEAGPPRWSPMNWAGVQLNLLEFVIHHEDIRRGDPDQPQPRELSTEENRVIFERLVFPARLSFRRAPVGVVLVSSQGDRKAVTKGTRHIELHGAPIELALHVSGRQRAAIVELVGAPDDIVAFRSWQQTR